MCGVHACKIVNNGACDVKMFSLNYITNDDELFYTISCKADSWWFTVFLFNLLIENVYCRFSNINELLNFLRVFFLFESPQLSLLFHFQTCLCM